MVELSMVDQSNKLLNDEIYNKVKVISIFLVYIDILTDNKFNEILVKIKITIHP